MATIKITELSARTLTSDTANTIFVGVDLETGITGKYTAKNMADNLYANNSLNVGNNFTLLSKPITFADGTTQNTSFVVTGTYANAAFLNANSAYNSQNTTGSYANSAYTQANTANTNAASGSLSIKIKSLSKDDLYVSTFLFTSRHVRSTIEGGKARSRCALRSNDV